MQTMQSIAECCFICHKEVSEVLKFPNGRRVYKCASCGLRVLRPLPDQKELNHCYDREEYLSEDLCELHRDLVFGYDDNSPIIKVYKDLAFCTF